MITGTILTSKLIKHLGIRGTLFASFTSEALTTLMYTFGGSFEQFLPIAYCDGVTSGVEMNSMMTAVSLITPSGLRGTGVGIYRTFMDVGSIVGPVGLTALLSAVGYSNIRICFYVSVALVAVVAGAMLTVGKEQMEEGNQH